MRRKFVQRWMVWLALAVLPLRLWAADAQSIQMMSQPASHSMASAHSMASVGHPAAHIDSGSEVSAMANCHGHADSASAGTADAADASSHDHTCGNCQACHSVGMAMASTPAAFSPVGQHCPHPRITHDATVCVAPLTKPPIG